VHGRLGVRAADRPEPGGGRRLLLLRRQGDGDDPAGDRRGRGVQERLKNVFVEGGISDYIKDATDGWSISPIILAWLVAVILRTALGSATVAVVTASGVVLPLLAGSGVHPEVMVLAVACGSIAFSHVNDPGFWLLKEYFHLSVIEAIKVRTGYTTVLAVLGLGGVLVAEQVLDVLDLRTTPSAPGFGTLRPPRATSPQKGTR
jgi:hypothetical protein